MENKVKNLEIALSNLLSNQVKIKELSNYGLLIEYKRLYLAVKYMGENGVSPTNVGALNAIASEIASKPVSSAEFKLATSCAELAILESFRAANYTLERFAGDDKKEKKEIAKKKKEINAVVGEILPDALNRVYDIMLDYGRDGKVFDARGRVVFDFEVFIDRINKAAHTTSVINNLPYIAQDATIKYRKVVKENSKDFLELLPLIGKNLSNIVESGAVRQTFSVNTDVRKLRRANRPLDKNGNALPSYVDFVNDDGTIVPYGRFLSTPTARLLNEFKTEEDYNNYVTSTAFWSYVSYLEIPMSDEAVDAGLPSFGLNSLPVSTGVDPYDTRRYAKEKIILPKDVYKNASKSSNETTTVTKLKNEKVIGTLNRVLAGALSVVILANSLGWPVKQIVDSIKDANWNNHPDGPTNPPTIEPEQTTPGNDNVETVGPDEIIDNPAEEIIPPEETTMPEDETTTPEIDIPTLPEETTTPEEDPSHDNPESPVPGHNNIDEDRREESTDDSFWFE